MGAPISAAEGQGVRLGEALVFPELTLSYFNETNVFRVSENESDASGFQIAPKVSLQANSGTLAFEAAYNGVYSQSDIDSTDYDDHFLTLAGFAAFNKRSRGSVGLSFSRRADKPGSGLALTTDGQLIELPIRNRSSLKLEHIFGAQNARGNLITGLNLNNNQYSSNSILSSRSDYSEVEPYVTLSLRLTGTTRGIVELSHSAQDYDESDDRDQTSLFFGLDWPDSEVFGGIAKIGVLDYEIGAESGTDIGLEMGIYYNPSSISNFDFTLERSLYDLNDALDAAASGNGVTISDVASLSWDYQWTSRVRHEALMSLDIKERECTSESQITTNVGVQFFFSIRQWISIGAGVEAADRTFDGCEGDSTTQDLNFSNQQVKASVRMTL